MTTTTDAGFDLQIPKTLKFEGGYANDPADPGGETNFGISKRSYPDLDIANLTKEQAVAIYHRDFWQRYSLGSLPPAIGAKVFDMAVNMGPSTAIAMLQRSCNHLFWKPMLAIDGALGGLTRGAAAGLDPITLLNTYRSECKNHYIAIASAHPVLRRYLNGWLRRASA